MVPVPLAHGGGWPEQQVDELFASLLGKGFESTTSAPTPSSRRAEPGGNHDASRDNANANDVDMAESDAQHHARDSRGSRSLGLGLAPVVVSDGFRVFG